MIFCKPYSDTSQDNDEDDDDILEQVASFKGVAQSYQLNFAPGIRNLHARLETAVREAADRLLTVQRTGRSMKYYLSLRSFTSLANQILWLMNPAHLTRGLQRCCLHLPSKHRWKSITSPSCKQWKTSRRMGPVCFFPLMNVSILTLWKFYELFGFESILGD